MFGFVAVFFFSLMLVFLIGMLGFIFDKDTNDAIVKATVCLIAASLLGMSGWYFQTHRIVPNQTQAITRSTFGQQLFGPYQSGIQTKPFFGEVWLFPASNNLERCEGFTPAIKGGYGVTLDVCFYVNARSVDWMKEIDSTGFFDYSQIMNTWRNNIVGEVAKSVKNYTPESLNDDRLAVEENLYANVKPWFDQRGIELLSLSFKNWDFTSEAVGAQYDESIASQRKSTEQQALLDAAKITRERETYEAETAKLVAEKQKEALNILNFSGPDAVQYLWIKLLSEQAKTPDTIILGGALPSVPTR